jgi:hypothetical protein
MNSKIFFALNLIVTATLLSACNDSSISESDPNSAITASNAAQFAGGVRGVKILLNTNTTTGSFTAPTVLPSFTPIPATYPGADTVTQYLPGVSPTQYFALDGVTVIPKPSWLIDFQLGLTTTTATNACATFGSSANTFDIANTYRVSEANCGAVSNGTGSSVDPVFTRMVIDRDPSQIGVAENLMVQVDYQASALHLNSDGTSTNVEDNLDQLWKIFWNTTLNPTNAATPFSLFVPPNYAACSASGSGVTDAPGICAPTGTYRGAPIKTRQFIIPLSAYPNMNVLQFSRVKGRVNQSGGPAYLTAFCNGAAASDSPLCLGVVIYAITLMRM